MKPSDVLPYPIWSRLQRARTWVAEWPERRRIAALAPRVPRDRIAVWSAGTARPAPGKALQGGRVKLGPLHERFPGSEEAFNVLYLVSSALPPAAGAWIELARSVGAKVVWNQNGMAFPGWIGRAYTWLNEPIRELLPRADHVLFQSAYSEASTAHFVGRIWKAGEVLHNAVDTDTFSPAEEVLPREPLVLICGGTAQSAYRVEVAFRTVEALQKRGRAVRLRMAGGMDFPGGRERAERLLARSGARDVTLLGPYARGEAPALFRSGHILLHTVYKDNCPTTVLEAMACGLPVVGTASGGVPELVGSDAGRLVAVPDTWDELVAADPERMADAVEDVAGRLDAMARAARERAVSGFGQAGWLARHEALFRRLVGI